MFGLPSGALINADYSYYAQCAAAALTARNSRGSPEQYHTAGFPNDGLYGAANSIAGPDAGRGAANSLLAFDSVTKRNFLFAGDTPHTAGLMAYMAQGCDVGIGQILGQVYLNGTDDLVRFATPIKASAVYIGTGGTPVSSDTVVAFPQGYHNMQFAHTTDCVIAMPDMDMTYAKSRVRVFLESVDGSVVEITDANGAIVTQVSNSAGQPLSAFSFNPGGYATTSAPFGQKTHVDFYYRRIGDEPGTERKVSYWFSCFNLSDVGDWHEARVSNLSLDKKTGNLTFDLTASTGTEVTLLTAPNLASLTNLTYTSLTTSAPPGNVTVAAKVVTGLPVTRWMVPRDALGDNLFFCPVITQGNSAYAAKLN